MQIKHLLTSKSEQLTNASTTESEVLTTELHFELLKQYAWLSSAVIGAIIILIQLQVLKIGHDVYLSLGLLGLSIFFAVIGQDHIVDSLLKGKSIYQVAKVLKFLRILSMGCLGLGAGYVSASVF